MIRNYDKSEKEKLKIECELARNTEKSEVEKFYRTLDWKRHIILSGEIDDSINKINYFEEN